MNILLTGATGFVGRNLIPKISVSNNIYILVRPSTDIKDRYGIKGIFIFKDNIEDLSLYLKENEIDGIIHLASLYIAQHQPNQIKDLVLSNIYLGTSLLEAGKMANVKWFLNTGTIWQNYQVPDKSDQYNPVNLYAATKQAFIDIAKFYTETSKIRFCTLKLCDTYGPNDTRRKIFSLFEQISESGETLDMSPGEQKMDIIYIDDVVSGFEHLAQLLNDPKQELRKEYVLSSGKQISLKKLANLYEKRYHAKLNINWGGRKYRMREVMKPYKGNVLIGWEPKIPFELF